MMKIAENLADCAEDCGYDIEPGDPIETDDWGKLRHVHCPSDGTPDTVFDHPYAW